MAWRMQPTSKYRAKTVNLDGEVFDSKKEARRFIELRRMECDGLISGLQRQKKFVLIPAQYEEGTRGPRGGYKKGKLLEREVAYYADFVYFDEEKREFVIEDVKGVRTPEYVIKRKLLLWLKGYQIREV